MIKKKSKEELLRQMLGGIVQETDITMVGKGSVTRGLASVFAGTIEQVYQTLDDAVNNSFLPTASGFYLDLFGETFGISRQLQTVAKVTASDRNLKVYVNSGTLAAVLPHPTDATLGRVPAGNWVETADGIRFTIDANYDFPAAATEVYVGATTSLKGTDNNVGVGELTTHSLGGALTTNLYPISTAQDVESDDDYRFRISRWVRTAAGKNEVAVRLAVLSAPDVAGMIKEPYFAGAGSFRITVIPTRNRVPVESLAQIHRNLAAVVSEGTFYLIEPPRYLPIAVTIRLIAGDGRSISASDRDRVRAAVLRYLGDIRPGESLVINRLRSVALNASSNVADIRVQGVSINGRPRALVNHRLRRDEIFVPDENVEDAILVV